MSYETLTEESRSAPEGVPFTQISNVVINNIKNGDAFLVWCYLFSKSKNWKTIKQNIKNVYGFGDAKLKQIFSYLKRSNLIAYAQANNANGQFAQTHIKVLNGSNFDIDQPYLANNVSNNQTYPQQNTGGSENRRAVDRTNGFDELQNTVVTKDLKALNTKRYRASEDAQSRFDEFWNEYPKKKDKKKTRKLWIAKKMDSMADKLIEDVKTRREKDNQWADVQYIPYPSTYIREERWEDEIILKSTIVKTLAPEYYQNAGQGQVRNVYSSFRDFTEERLEKERSARLEKCI